MLVVCITMPSRLQKYAEWYYQCNICWYNPLRPRQNGRHFADDIFKRIFINQNIWFSIKISLKFVPWGLINNIPALIQIMAWRRPGDKPLSEPMMVSLLGLNELMVLEITYSSLLKVYTRFSRIVANCGYNNWIKRSYWHRYSSGLMQFHYLSILELLLFKKKKVRIIHEFNWRAHREPILVHLCSSYHQHTPALSCPCNTVDYR